VNLCATIARRWNQYVIQHGKAAQLLSAHSRLIDQYCAVSGGTCLAGTIALVAVGGYGVASYIQNPTSIC